MIDKQPLRFVPTKPENKTRAKFHRDKAGWRKTVKVVIIATDNMCQSHMRGDYVSMGVLYETGRRVAKVGERGVRLRHRMDDHGIVKRERVHESIASTCKLLEAASKIIQTIAEKQGTPLIEFPLFISELAASSTMELGAQDALKQLMEETV